MAYYEQEFDEYKIIHWCNYRDEIARINCYMDGSLIGILYFLDEVQEKHLLRRSRRIIHLQFPLNQFSEIITTLRYEKPLYLFYNDNDPTPFGGLKTSSHEPVGEEEGG